MAILDSERSGELDQDFIDSEDGQFLAWAAYSPNSKIRARVWSFDEKQRIDASFIHIQRNS